MVCAAAGRSSQLNAVMEGGQGSPPLMAILYSEARRHVCILCCATECGGARAAGPWDGGRLTRMPPPAVLTLLAGVHHATLSQRGAGLPCSPFSDTSACTLSARARTACCCPAQVARRVGLPLHFLLLDGAQYCLLWPPSAAPQPSLLIDPYHNGDLLASEEAPPAPRRPPLGRIGWAPHPASPHTWHHHPPPHCNDSTDSALMVY